jgi:hypothetical protein
MNDRSKKMRIWGALIFACGILVGIVFTVCAVWADLESTLYFTKLTNVKLTTLKCPVFMTKTEEGKITATFKNTIDRHINPSIRAEFSSPGLTITAREFLPLEVGEKKQVEWTVNKDNIDLKFFIFAKVYSTAEYPIPAREGTCGIFVLNLPGLTGMQVEIILFAVSILCLVAGLWLWQASSPDTLGRTYDATRALRFLALLVLAGMIVGSLGWWIVGVLLLVLIVLMSVSIFFFALAPFEKKSGPI